MKTMLGYGAGTTIADLKGLAKEVGLVLNGVYMKDLLIDVHPREGAYIVNMDNFINPVTNGTSHWVAVYLLKDSCLYFDSFAVAPPTEIVEFCSRWAKPIVFNVNKELQSIDEGFCGQWTIYFLKYVQQRRRQKGKHVFTAFLNSFADRIPYSRV